MFVATEICFPVVLSLQGCLEEIALSNKAANCDTCIFISFLCNFCFWCCNKELSIYLSKKQWKLTNKQQPLLLRIRPIVDNLTVSQRRMPVKHLHRRRISLHRPMVHRHLGDQRQGVQRYPLPKDNVFVHSVRFHFRLHFDVEDLQCLLSWWGKTLYVKKE